MADMSSNNNNGGTPGDAKQKSSKETKHKRNIRKNEEKSARIDGD